MTIAERLKECRTASNQTQKFVAELLRVTTRTYQYYESGNLEPNLETLSVLADNFNVTTDYLLCKTNTKKAPAEAEAEKNEFIAKVDRLPPEKQKLILDMLNSLLENQQ
jgi:transcriptional regulator with XRE-family HTH domain